MLLFALSAPAFAWGHHYLITDGALRHPSVAAQAEEEVVVEDFEAFVNTEAPALDRAFADFAQWSRTEERGRFAEVPFPEDQPSREAFLRAARLNPAAGLPLALRRLPGQAARMDVDPRQLSPYLVPKEPLLTAFDVVVPGQPVTVRAVVATAADEPDWGFDHELWGFAEYGYGEQPYGKPTGESSKAAFHMLFANENILVRLAAPHVLEGMVMDRVALFQRLAAVAFEGGHDYWGWRFTGWAVHYLQDIAQPYHSKAVPSANLWWYIRYVFSSEKAKMQEEASQLAANKHFVYEDFVAWGLQEEVRAGAGALRAFLTGGEAAFEEEELEDLVERVGDDAADHAGELDRALVEILGPRLTEDPAYDVETAPDYSIAGVIAQMPEEKKKMLLENTGVDFEAAAKATRTMVGRVRP